MGVSVTFRLNKFSLSDVCVWFLFWCNTVFCIYDVVLYIYPQSRKQGLWCWFRCTGWLSTGLMTSVCMLARQESPEARCTFRIIDDSTISAVIPVSEADTRQSLDLRFLPKYKNVESWVSTFYLNVGKNPNSSNTIHSRFLVLLKVKMKLLIRVERGLLRKLIACRASWSWWGDNQSYVPWSIWC